ncbi:MAG: CYTH domain-containing protein [Phycisphaerae bacterium]|nr:CYTH domain-containing protein [Phycisphaerae bacterium]
MRNVEYKSELRDPALAESIARSLGAAPIGVQRQVDTYFRLAEGRFKRREIDAEPPEYILYRRADSTRTRVSCYDIFSDAAARERFGSLPMSPWVVVRKRRTLFMLGHVRVHFDHVERLGAFFELEALVSPRNTVAACHQRVHDLVTLFAPALGEPISASYSDMIAAQDELPDDARPDPRRDHP